MGTLVRLGTEFVKGWTAHEKSLDARFSVYKDHIIVVTVNEAHHEASGCSIDKLTRFMKDAGSKFQADLLDRMHIVYETAAGLAVAKTGEIRQLLSSGTINGDTTIYDLSDATGPDPASWRKPLRDTWAKKYLVPA